MTKQELRNRFKDFTYTSAKGIDLSETELLLAYKNMKSEVDVSGIVQEAIAKGIKVVFAEKDPYCFQGVKIAEINCKAIMLIPGVAFTNDGKRLGRGGGFYDRTLSVLPACVQTIGICKKTQIMKDLPTEPHDMKVQKVLAF